MKSYIFALRYIEVGENMNFCIKAKQIGLKLHFLFWDFQSGDKKGQSQAYGLGLYSILRNSRK